MVNVKNKYIIMTITIGQWIKEYSWINKDRVT